MLAAQIRGKRVEHLQEGEVEAQSWVWEQEIWREKSAGKGGGGIITKKRQHRGRKLECVVGLLVGVQS